jgi:glycine cleavage system H protein
VADYDFPDGLLFTSDDEWIRVEDDQVVIGISDFAQTQLGDIVFVDLPEIGTSTEVGLPFGTIESVKAVSDLCAPLSGEVLEINESLEDTPEKVNESCYGEGWLIRLRPSDRSQLDALMSTDAYRKSVAERDTDS